MITTQFAKPSIRHADANATPASGSEFLRREATSLLGYTLFLIYLSLVPFDLDIRSPAATTGSTLFGLRAAQISLPDIAANIAFYLPFGAIWFHLLRQRGRSRASAGLWTTIVCTSLSVAIEQAQRLFPSRVGSWVDVSSNLVGALLGVGILWLGEDAIRRAAGRTRELAARRWWLVVSRAFVVIVLLVQLRPFDPVIDPHHAAASALRRTDARPWARWQELETRVKAHHPGNPEVAAMQLSRSRWEYGLDRVVDVALYAAVAALFIVGRSRNGSIALGHYIMAGLVSVGLAAVATGARVFLISHGLDTLQIACGLVGWPIGCFFGWAWARRVTSRSDAAVVTRTGPPPVTWQRGLACVGIAMVILYEIVPFDFSKNSPAGLLAHANVSVVPFAAHRECRINQALYDLSGDGLRYAIVGMGLAMLLRIGHRRRETRVCVALAMLICAVLETLHLWMPSRFTDVTTLAMAAAGSFAGVAVLQWAQGLYARLATVVAADPLTSQLMEGATYQPLPAPAARSEIRRGEPRAGTSPKDPARSTPRR
ncbi:MAG TPA: VanZ family protein [Phycisphaerae bacterium]|nr:VanZ family protein [Phycisphaerae bacterium]